MARGMNGRKAKARLDARRADFAKLSSREAKVQQRIEGGGFHRPGSMNGRKG